MIIGIDPAASKPHAIAVYEDGLLISVYKSSDLIEIYSTIEQCDKVYIEDQYFHRNPAVLKKLAQASGELIGICKLVKVPYMMVPPSQWLAYFNLYGKKPEGIKPGAWQKRKETMLKDKAEELVSWDITDADIAATILIGWFGMNTDKSA